MDHLFTDIPIWGVFLGTLFLGLAAVEFGYRWARHRQGEHQLEKEAPVGAMVGATLGLLAFLLAFTFGIAADAFHARKVALVDEANAIRMAYLLTSVIPEAQRSEIRAVLREYVDERLRWAEGEPDGPGRSAKDLTDRLWQSAAIVGAQNPGGVDVFLEHVSRIIELQQERIMVREQSRIPSGYWVVLYIVAVLSLSAVGYHSGVVIADLDRPGEGFINVSQAPMFALQETLRVSKP